MKRKTEAICHWNGRYISIDMPDGSLCPFIVSSVTERFLNTRRNVLSPVVFSLSTRAEGDESLCLLATAKLPNGDTVCHYVVANGPWEGSITVCPMALRLLFGHIPKRITLSVKAVGA